MENIVTENKNLGMRVIDVHKYGDVFERGESFPFAETRTRSASVFSDLAKKGRIRIPVAQIKICRLFKMKASL